MKKIETLEQLRAEQKRLQAAVKHKEDELKENVSYFTSSIQSFLSVFETVNNGIKSFRNLGIISTFLGSKEEPKTRVNAGGSPAWATVGLMALQFLTNSDIGKQLAAKLANFIVPSKTKRQSKRRHKKTTKTTAKEDNIQ